MPFTVLNINWRRVQVGTQTRRMNDSGKLASELYT